MKTALLNKDYFYNLCEKFFSLRKDKEHFSISYSAESSHFLRVNQAKVRQNGLIEDGELSIHYFYEISSGDSTPLKHVSSSITLTGLSYLDHEELKSCLNQLRQEAESAPMDPYAVLPKSGQSSEKIKTGSLLHPENAPETLLNPVSHLDIVGIYASGPVVRAMANTSGLFHWFATETFSFDYSIFTPQQKAIKGTYAGISWDNQHYLNEIEKSKSHIALIERPSVQIERGAYRTYLEPAAVSELVQMLSWNGVSEASIQQGDSPLVQLRKGEKEFSPLFHLKEDFRGGEVPQFNSDGDLAPEVLPLIDSGKLKNTWISTRTAKEYGLQSNGATQYEGLRSPVVEAGKIDPSQKLKELDTGLYLSNLHYLNWSDLKNSRVTGMTRYACFWVEKGQIKAPIENLRFDDTLFNLFGNRLIGLTQSLSYLPEVGTYGRRSLGGMWSPGILVSEMKFTL